MEEKYLLFFLIFVFAFILLTWLLTKTGIRDVDSSSKRAGQRGEKYANDVIREILRADDTLLTNVCVCIDDKQTELDNVVINRKGIYIIEVKNYSGDLYGHEDDYEWEKIKTTPGGIPYKKNVKNPIKQVKRQVYILSHFLKSNGINLWIDGYVFLVRSNSSVESSYILKSQYDIDKAIHINSDNKINTAVKNRIIKLLC